MQQTAELAELVRDHRQPSSSDNYLFLVQSMISEGIITTLNNWRDFRDRTMEQFFLGIYNSTILQALTGLLASDGELRRHPGMEPAWIEFIIKRINELKSHIADGGIHEAAVRSLIYINIDKPVIDERNFELFRQIRSKRNDITLAELKKLIREQFFAILLDRDTALAAIPTMLLPTNSDDRTKTLEAIIQITSATGELTSMQAECLAHIEKLFNVAR